ncbi:thioredoxin domain-containing protein [Tenacibaculum sp. MAR_2009_124]|uniref:thioredoxin domain-containing protein n=1 Tax=Tenacibaculum sp. MAR_2009_124 TaxID=1250059 RepID=UPI0015A3A7EF|nr:thioredoxin domain-containing protein [Tenacibaculum sp. MAR_2009_124]
MNVLLIVNCSKKAKNTSTFTNTKNTLTNELSPYLKKHSDDPVFWNTWNDSSLNFAKENNKLIVLSIGFSSCHWCHVMEKETFEDQKTANVMNDHFVNIKVDREERPDIDHLYMSALQLMTGKGGWPLNVILLPNGKPIYGGTYHTKKQWNSVLQKILELHKNKPEELTSYAKKLSEGLTASNLIEINTDIPKFSKQDFIDKMTLWKPSWDTIYGQEITKEKFIKPGNLKFLMNYAYLMKDTDVSKQVKTTLDKMYQGGIFDHLQGGFFRYSTDHKWQLPHFEKMLYTNAQILSTYADAYMKYKDQKYKHIIEKTIQFLEVNMQSSNGGYISSIDADNEGKEGAYYVWTKDELKKTLGKKYTSFISSYKLIPQENNDSSYVVSKNPIETSFSREEMKSIDLLLNKRKQRIQPHKDIKKITSWNSLLISGFLDAYKALGDKNYLNMAESLAEIIHTEAFTNGKLQHLFNKNAVKREGFLDDYAYYISANLKLYSITGKSTYATRSSNLTKIVVENFGDGKNNMFTYARKSDLVSPIVKLSDGVLPSPNSVMAENLKQLSIIYGNKAYNDRFTRMIMTISPYLKENFSNYLKWGNLHLQELFPIKEIVVVGIEAENKSWKFQNTYLPNTLIYFNKENLPDELPLFKHKYVEGATYIYVCEKGFCKLPVTSVEKAIKMINHKSYNL